MRRRRNYKIIEEIEGAVVKLPDSSTVSLCLILFARAKSLTAKGGLKIHTCLDKSSMIPEMINITAAKIHDR